MAVPAGKFRDSIVLWRSRGNSLKRREFLSLLAGTVAPWPSFAFAQQNQAAKRIGLMANLPLPPIERFREKLQKLGWVEGKNLIIEYRYGEGRDDRFPEFAAELVAMPVDVIVVWGNPAAFAAKRATTTIPILIGAAGDVVNTGLISNLARPDANLTGFIALNVDLESKRLELLKEAIPRLSRVVVLANPANPLSRVNLDTAHKAAEKLAIKIEVVAAKSAADVEGALAQIKDSHPDAALLAADTQLLSKRKEIADFMVEQRIPAIYPFREYADVGGLFIYGANLSVLFEKAADYLDRLLKGEKVRNLPVQQATTFELIVNLKTASAIGLTVAPDILLRADEVIE
jgi:putative tryptophan/tyrosine transport system substrate-binding protein